MKYLQEFERLSEDESIPFEALAALVASIAGDSAVPLCDWLEANSSMTVEQFAERLRELAAECEQVDRPELR